MAQIACRVENTRYQWVTTAYLTYSTAYDPDKNQTTLTLESCKTTYWGASGYYTTYTTNITAAPTDGTAGAKTAQCAVTSTTNGGSKDFAGTPSPTVLVLQHSDADGDKEIKIDVAVSIYAAMTSAGAQATATGTATATIKTGERASSPARIAIDGAAVKATPYVGKNKAAAYRGRVKM